MKITKIVKRVASVGGFFVKVGSKVGNFADHVIHHNEYEARKKRNRIIKICLIVAGGILLVLLFPYKLVVKKNGDFEIRTLLLRIYRKSDEYDLPEGGPETFDIEGVETCECELAD